MLKKGDLLLDKFRVESLAGSGGFGEVYQVIHPTLGARAIKVLRKDMPGVGSTDIENGRTRFKTEARLGGYLNHPNVIKVLDFDERGDELYLVMEYAQGGSLKKRLKEKGPLSIEETVRLGMDVCAGLQAIHEKHIVHRDITPSNILFAEDESARICDLGLAQLGDDDGRSMMGSVAPEHPGSAKYMSPEQENTKGYLLPSSDIFSLGCVLFECLTGILYKHNYGGHIRDDRKDLPIWLDSIVERALAETPGKSPVDDGNNTKRYRTAQLMRADLERGWQEETARREAERVRRLEIVAEEERNRQWAEEQVRLKEERARKAKAAAKAERQRIQLEEEKKSESERNRKAMVASEEENRRKQAEVNLEVLNAEHARKAEVAEAGERKNKKLDDESLRYGERADSEKARYEAKKFGKSGLTFSINGDYDQAISAFNTAIELDPDEAEYYRNRGVCYHMKKDDGLAIVDYFRAIQLNPRNADYYRDRGVSYHAKNDFAQAIADFTKAIEINPSKADYYSERGMSHRKGGDEKSAILDFNKALELDPTQRAIGNFTKPINITSAEESARRDKRALEADQKMRQTQEALAAADRKRREARRQEEGRRQSNAQAEANKYRNTGLSYYNAGDFNRAIENFTKAIELTPSNAANYLNRGVSYDMKGDERLARRDYNKSLELDPSQARAIGQLKNEVREWKKKKGISSKDRLLFFGAPILVLIILISIFLSIFPRAESATSQENIATLSPNAMNSSQSLPSNTPPALLSPTAISVVATDQATITATLAPTPVLEIGSTLTGIDGMTLLYVPAGEFTMGSDLFANERPIHKVYLDSYWIDQTEVTNEQYAKCVLANECSMPGLVNIYGKVEYKKFPVLAVDWNQSRRYCEWAKRRLPTEAEWEKAARGTDNRIYPWGNSEPSSIYLNYAKSDITYVGKYPVGASPYGALDMAGNAWEWVSSLYKEYPYTLTDDRENMISGDARVIRGYWEYEKLYSNRGPTGFYSWVNSSHRLTLRVREALSTANENFGFRCASSTSPSLVPAATPIIAIESPLPTSLATPVVGSTLTGNDGMTLLYVPAGEFTMGSDSSDQADEKPAHTVNLDAFWIDQTEVTNKQYAACVSSGASGGCTRPSNTSSYTNTSYYGNNQFDDYPVIYVNWNQAKAYCEWAGRRLPTEAEWERAARGTDGRTYPWGNSDPSTNLLNFNSNVGDTTPVGNYPNGVSLYGAYDMAGNVWEWVNDWYSDTYYQRQHETNPPGASSGSFRVLRGGSWDDFGYSVRSSYRVWYDPTYTDINFGFRCARSH